jgi:periplasmic protein TonB
MALGITHRHEAREMLARMVWVEPAPPPAPPLGGGAPDAPAVVAPPAAEPLPAPVVPPRPVVAPKPKREPRPLVRQERKAPRSAPSAPPAEVAPPPPAAVAPPGPGTAAGVAGGGGTVVGGTADGAAGGTVGGLGDQPLGVRDVATPPELVRRVMPEYPRQARAREIEGQVVLEIVLDRNGRIEQEVRVLRSIPALDTAAITAVRQWKFRPARDRAGNAVRVVMEVPVRFVLR